MNTLHPFLRQDELANVPNSLRWVFDGHLVDNGVTYCWSNGKYRDSGDKKFHFDCKDGRWAYMDDSQHVWFGYGTQKFSFNQDCWATFYDSGTACKGTNYC